MRCFLLISFFFAEWRICLAYICSLGILGIWGRFKYLHWYDLLFNFFIGLVYSDALRGIYIGLVIDGSGVETDS